ncbi:MAG TPA: membrane protein insertion efficiency factor YidD [Desulfocapsa sulfexigens]|nr:membrane protein insertion efficiency factor YidD [Desulfocapsa sulfexigens]
MQKICLGMIRGYRYIISPLLPQSCRFTPTCSRYAMQAIKEHGTLRGGFLSFGRIMRCHPFCHGGYDPVPPVVCCRKTSKTISGEVKDSTDKTCGI